MALPWYSRAQVDPARLTATMSGAPFQEAWRLLEVPRSLPCRTTYLQHHINDLSESLTHLDLSSASFHAMVV